MNRYFVHALAAAWMLCVAGSASAQCQAGMPTVPGAGCVPREYIENNRGGGSQQPQQSAPEVQWPTYGGNYRPPPPVIEFGAHAMTSDNASLFGGTGSLSAGDAQRLVVNFCEKRSGKPCRVLSVFKDSCQAYAFDQRNTPYRGVDIDPRMAAHQAVASCAHASGKGQCRLWKLPICAGNDYVNSDFNAKKNWIQADYDAQVEAWTVEAKRGLR